ncbi:MAG: hypothetical protein ACSHX7_01170 [Luteolibacter sp.]
MAQQSNKIIKRRRRANYLKRKKEQAKLGGILPKAKVKKSATKADAPDKEAAAVVKKAAKKAAKKAPAKKAAKKAPAKKAAKKAAKPKESTEE